MRVIIYIRVIFLDIVGTKPNLSVFFVATTTKILRIGKKNNTLKASMGTRITSFQENTILGRNTEC